MECLALGIGRNSRFVNHARSDTSAQGVITVLTLCVLVCLFLVCCLQIELIQQLSQVDEGELFGLKSRLNSATGFCVRDQDQVHSSGCGQLSTDLFVHLGFPCCYRNKRLKTRAYDTSPGE